MQWFKNLKTVTKLMLAFAVMSLLMVVVGYQGISAAKTINDMLTRLYDRDLVGLSRIQQASVDLAKIGREARAVVISTDQAEMQQISMAIDQEFKEFDDSIAAADPRIASEEGKAQMARIKELRPGYESDLREILRLAMAGNDKAAEEKLKVAKARADQIMACTETLKEIKERLGKQAYEESDQLYTRLRSTLISILCVSALLALGLGYFIAQLIAKPLNAAVHTLHKVADLDLTTSLTVDTRDEVGEMSEALNRTIEQMRTALTQVRESAEGMANSAQELASASEELSSGAQEQASSLEETTATLEEITSTVKQNADNAKQASQVATGSRDTAEKGGHVVAEAVSAMAEINEASKNIADIITTIDEIAFQTNLLALNAAVEAARAGEQGRGFAVVATEVRNLAQRSATSAKEIKRLIQDSVRKVENGSGLVNKSGENLHQIVDSVKHVTDIVAEIASASREQSTGIEQVNKAMLQMDQVTQTNSSQTEELSATAQSLASTAEQLQALVARFRIDTELRSGVQRLAPKHNTAASAIRKVTTSTRTAAAGVPMQQVPVAKAKPNGQEAAEANAFIEF